MNQRKTAAQPRPARGGARRTRIDTRKAGRKPIRREISAGGVVVRRSGQDWLVALLQTEHKRGKVWVLPKGHVELHNGEKIAEAARREVQEEAGIEELTVKNQLGVTRFAFQAENTLVRKTVHYFLMITRQEDLTPQTEEGLIAAAWVPLDQAVRKLAYDTDQDIVKRAASWLVRPTDSFKRKGRGQRRLRIHI